MTCPYLGKPLPGFWAWFGAQFINDWFAPNVLLTRLFGDSPCAFGSTLALRRSALAEAGGLEGIKDAIADDYRLAESLRRLGLRTVLSECFVSTDVTEASARQLASRELRWLRLSFNVQPLGFAFALPSFALLTGLAGALLASQPAGWLLLAITLLTRLAIQKAMRRLQPAATPRGAIAAALLMPLREAFSAALWASAFVRRRVRWQGKDFCYAANGAIQTPHHPDQPRHAENPVPAPPVV